MMYRAAPIPGRGSQRRFTTAHAPSRGITLPAYHPAVRAGRTAFPSRVFAPDEVLRVLKSGRESRKIGKTVTKGHLRGAPIFTLTLEERATCPSSCGEWATCYGNRMQAAERIEHGGDLLRQLSSELDALSASHPLGYLVRLHVLGDFWATDYVRWWGRMLARHGALHVFGFTAHVPDSDIGRSIAQVTAQVGWKRFAVRFSGAHGRDLGARVIGPGEDDPDAIACPAQTGATDCCATCALCWQSDRSISFQRH
jgi:hypothetical protein